MANFIHVSTLAVWLCAVAVLSVAAGVPYGPVLATICSLPLLILSMGLGRPRGDSGDSAQPSELKLRLPLGELLAWIPNFVVLATVDVFALYYLATNEHQYRNGVEPYYWLAFGAWVVGIVTGAIGVAIEKSRERAKKKHRATA